MTRFFKFKSIVFAVFTLCFISTFAHDAFSVTKPATKYDSDQGYLGNSLQEYEEFKSWGGKVDDCMSSGKIFSDDEALTNTQIPMQIGRDVKVTAQNSVQSGKTAALIIRAVGYAAIGMASFGIGFIIAAIDYGIMIDVCSNTYVLSAAERVSLGMVGTNTEPKVSSGNICLPFGKDEAARLDPTKLDSKRVYTSNEIPYMFHCDAHYDPSKDNGNNPDGTPKDMGGMIDKNTNQLLEIKKIGRTYGYAGAASMSCHLGLDTEAMKQDLGSIIVGTRALSFGAYSTCEPKLHSYGKFKAGDAAKVGGVDFYTFYFQQPRTGKIRLCAIAPYTFFPVMVGCSTIAPPMDEMNTDEFIAGYVKETRCEYLLKARKDLASLGEANMGGAESSSVNKFLLSDLHVTSTVVGCVKDMLLKIFMGSPSGAGIGGDTKNTFFKKVQARMKQMVMAALTLYVALVGIKIMTAGQPPTRAEGVMYVVKFALVFWFATGDAWYKVENNHAVGLYPGMLDITEELTSIFLEAQNKNDPLSACRHTLASSGQNILSNNDIPVGSVPNGVATAGYPGIIKTTVWDLVDCKVVNYLSFGTCNYTLGGMMSPWLFVGMIFTDFPLAISLLIYTLMVLLTVFKFAHIFILSIFTITILVFLSPIFLLFALFEPTKGMFQKWMQMLLGYTLYPALLFAFVSLMFATFDAVFYGDLNFDNTANSVTTESICKTPDKKDVESIFCVNMKQNEYKDPCTGSITSLSTDLIESQKVVGIGGVKKVSADYATSIRTPVLRLMLFSLLFYLFLGAVTEFMAVLVGVQGLGSIALDPGKAAISLAKSGAGQAAGAAGKVAGAAAKQVGKRAGGS